MIKLIIKDIKDSISNHEDYLNEYVHRFGYDEPTVLVETGFIAGLKEALGWIEMETGEADQ